MPRISIAKPIPMAAGLGMLSIITAALHMTSLASDHLPRNTRIVMQRGACEKRCAVYDVTLFADGTSRFEGRHFVHTVGIRQGTVPTQALRAWLRELDQANFWSLDREIGVVDRKECREILTDGPVTTLTVTSGDRSKTIRHDHRCRGPVSDRLSALEDRLDQIAHTRRWVRE